MTTLLAVDDGIWTGNYNLADVFFLIAVILAVISALAHYRPTSAGHAGWLLSAAVAAAALGWLVLWPMATLRRVILFLLGVYLIVYALTVHPVQIALVVTALLLMGVVSWDQLAGMIRRNGHDHPDDDR